MREGHGRKSSIALYSAFLDRPFKRVVAPLIRGKPAQDSYDPASLSVPDIDNIPSSRSC